MLAHGSTFFHEKKSAALGLRDLFGAPRLAVGTTWAAVVPVVLALPASALVTVVASLATRAELAVQPRSTAARAA